MRVIALLVGICLLMTTSCYAAEFLVKAKPNWKSAWTSEDVNGLSKLDKQEYEARTMIGDIIVVKPDGWKWGDRECFPNYVIVKILGMTLEEAQKYQNAENDKDGNTLKHRKYRFDKQLILDANMAKENIIYNSEISMVQNITDRTKAP